MALPTALKLSPGNGSRSTSIRNQRAIASWSTRDSKTTFFLSLGGRPIAEIRPAELLGVIRKIENRDARIPHTGLLEAVARCSATAFRPGRCERDITADLRGALKPVEEQHFAAVTTPSEIGGILRAIDGYTGTFVVRSAFRLAPLVFVRPGELRKAKWQDMDLDEAKWLLELSKIDDSKARRDDVDEYLIVPLSRQSVEEFFRPCTHSLAATCMFSRRA